MTFDPMHLVAWIWANPVLAGFAAGIAAGLAARLAFVRRRSPWFWGAVGALFWPAFIVVWLLPYGRRPKWKTIFDG